MDTVITNLLRRVAELERRLKNTIREGKVSDVDYKKGLIRVQDGDVKSPWVPWVERAGDIRTWTPPAKDEQVIMVNPSGEPGQGWIIPGQFSDKFKQNHDAGGEHKMTIGSTFLHLTGDSLHIKTGTILLECSGTATIKGATIVTDGDTKLGGPDADKQVHRKDDVDSDGDLAVTHASKVWAK